MLIHEAMGASDCSSLAYISAKFAPCVPLCLWGMSAREERLQKDPESAGGRSKPLVGRMWLDSVLPIGAGNGIPPYTKIIVVESDWREFEADLVVQEAGATVLGEQHHPESLQQTPCFGRSSAMGMRARRAEQHSSIGDLLKIWTTAARLKKKNEEQVQGGYGNLIWFSYRPTACLRPGDQHFDFAIKAKDERERNVGIGCYLIGLTGAACSYILQKKVHLFLDVRPIVLTPTRLS